MKSLQTTIRESLTPRVKNIRDIVALDNDAIEHRDKLRSLVAILNDSKETLKNVFDLFVDNSLYVEYESTLKRAFKFNGMVDNFNDVIDDTCKLMKKYNYDVERVFVDVFNHTSNDDEKFENLFEHLWALQWVIAIVYDVLDTDMESAFDEEDYDVEMSKLRELRKIFASYYIDVDTNIN